MPKQQNTEYKSSWYDDYLKWICDLANETNGFISARTMPNSCWKNYINI
jgi:hypothetical protein